MNKFRHMCYGRCFVWVTDCYAVKFILSYDGANQAILHLQMRLMGWDVDIGLVLILAGAVFCCTVTFQNSTSV
jgi:hypothetical protein